MIQSIISISLYVIITSCSSQKDPLHKEKEKADKLKKDGIICIYPPPTDTANKKLPILQDTLSNKK